MNLEKSAEALRAILRRDARNREAAANLAYVLAALNRPDEADAVLRKILREFPDDAQLYAVWGSVMQVLNRSEAAISAYSKALTLKHPEAVAIHDNMAVALCQQGRHAESVEHSEMALKMAPNDPRLYSNLLLTLHYLPEAEPRAILDRHKRWPGNTLRPVNAFSATGRKTRRPERLRIGYVSSDFRRHSVAAFIEPLFKYHDAARYEITCYFSHAQADTTTERLRQMAHRWRNVVEMDDDKLLQLIIADGIDVLVDLNGHTTGNRLPVFARRAAPVQVSFIGYPDTTGITQMDYRFADSISDPPGTEAWCIEKLVRLPGCFLCYEPPVVAPAVTPPPFEKNGFVTFGSFNNLAKINSAVISVWARLLRAAPESRLFIKNPSLTEEITRDRYRALFAAEGIPHERLDLFGYVAGDAAHLAVYERVDVALDTFPYNGTTTTCEALWMGVPVVTLRGNRHSARVGASILGAAGFPQGIAESVDEYVRIATRLGESRAALKSVRSELRRQVAISPVCAANNYARSVEAAYEEMFRAAFPLSVQTES